MMKELSYLRKKKKHMTEDIFRTFSWHNSRDFFENCEQFHFGQELLVHLYHNCAHLLTCPIPVEHFLLHYTCANYIYFFLSTVFGLSVTVMNSIDDSIKLHIS